MKLNLTIHTPEKQIFDGFINRVCLPGALGPFTILRSHAPLVGTLLSGPVTYYTKGSQHQIMIEEGLVQVKQNQVQVWLPKDPNQAIS